MKSKAGFTGRIIERVLELSADAQIERRRTTKDSPVFHNLSGAIAAYGNLLGHLTALQELEEFDALLDELGVLDCFATLAN